MIDIVMSSYNRLTFIELVITELHRRTRTPFNLIVVDDASTDGSSAWLTHAHRDGLVDTIALLQERCGIHQVKNIGLANVSSSPYFLDTDNDLVPQNDNPDWLSLLISLMDNNPDYGAIACRPHVLIGEPGDRFDNCGEIREMSHAGAHLRIMRTSAVREAGGWKDVRAPGRNNEDWHIAGGLKRAGLKVGYSRDIRCIHLWGDEDSSWGYSGGENVGHREISPPVHIYNWNRQGVDWETCKPIPTT